MTRPEQEASDFTHRPAKWLLLVLLAGGEKRRYNEPIAGKTKLVKEIFLLDQARKEIAPRYEFKAYDYGPFSADILRDLDEMKERGLVQAEPGYGGEVYSLTERGVGVARVLWSREDPKTLAKIFDIKVRFNRMPLSQLLSYVYDRYPRFADKSVLESLETVD